jgi:hypothetical protein
MYDHGQKKPSSNSAAGKPASMKDAERRGAHRHAFTASAEVTEVNSGARFSTRTTDLGPGGCFVDTVVPFPVGAKVRINVRKAKTEFQTGGVVVYSQPGLGMGIAFDQLDLDQRRALEAWINSLTGERLGLQETPQAPKADLLRPDRAALVRLVQLMITKGILTEAEGSSVLHEPVL